MYGWGIRGVLLVLLLAVQGMSTAGEEKKAGITLKGRAYNKTRLLPGRNVGFIGRDALDNSKKPISNLFQAMQTDYQNYQRNNAELRSLVRQMNSETSTYSKNFPRVYADMQRTIKNFNSTYDQALKKGLEDIRNKYANNLSKLDSQTKTAQEQFIDKFNQICDLLLHHDDARVVKTDIGGNFETELPGAGSYYVVVMAPETYNRVTSYIVYPAIISDSDDSFKVKSEEERFRFEF